MSGRWSRVLAAVWLAAVALSGGRVLPFSASAGPSPTRLLHAWAQHPQTGDLLVIDSSYRVERLRSIDLRPMAKSAPLFPEIGDGRVTLAAGGRFAAAGAEAITTTVLLEAADLQPIARFPAAGPVAVDADGNRLFVISGGRLLAFRLDAPAEPPNEIVPALRPGSYGDVPRDVWVEPRSGRLYVRFYAAYGSPPHNREFMRSYRLSDLQPDAELERALGTLTRPAFAENGSLAAIGLAAMNGYWGSGVSLYDHAGDLRRSVDHLPGIPALDPDGRWLYHLRDRGLWVLDARSFALRAVVPLTGPAPIDLTVSLDGRRLFLLEEDGVRSLDASEARSAGIAAVGPLPRAWLPDAARVDAPAFFASPTMPQDGAGFMQPDEYAETYRTLDGGASWQFLPSVTYPVYRAMRYLSLSPDFARDRTLVGRPGGLQPLERSHDAGDAWMPWGPRIAFVSDRAGSRDVYTMDAAGRSVRRITDDPADEENPAWSPAWTYLAYQANPDGNWDLFTVRADCRPGANCVPRRLTDGPGDDVLPAWSPDGRTIAFVSTRDGNPEIYAMRADGTGVCRLTFSPTGDWRPAWMPDGRRLVFTSDRAGTNDVYRLTVPAEGAATVGEPPVELLVGGPSDDRDPTVNAENNLAFLSDRDGVTSVYELDLRYDFAQPRRHTDAERAEGHPSWIDDLGYDLLVTIEAQGNTHIFVSQYPNTYRPLTTGSGFNGHPAWGPAWWRPGAPESLAQLEALR